MGAGLVNGQSDSGRPGLAGRLLSRLSGGLPHPRGTTMQGSGVGAINMPTGRGMQLSPAMRLFIRDLPTAVAVIDLDGHAWIWNAAAEAMLPPPPHPLGAASYPLFSLASQSWFEKAKHDVLLGHSVAGLLWHVRGIGCVRRRIEVSLSPLHDDSGNLYALAATLVDRTDEHRRRRSLRRRAERERALLEQAPVGILVHRSGRIVYTNRAATRQFGASSAEVLSGRTYAEFVIPENKAACERDADAARIAVIRALDGSYHRVEVAAAPIRYRGRPATQVILRGLPSTGSTSTGPYVHTAAPAAQGVVILDALGFVETWDAGAEAITGFRAEDIVGRDLAAIFTPEAQERDDHGTALRTAITQGRHQGEGWKRRRDGTRFWCSVAVVAQYNAERKIEGFVVVLRDLTAQHAGDEAARRTEDQLRQAQRMEAIGRLAGGIAHDFNNLLTAINGHAQFLLDDLDENHPSRTDAEEIRRSADRASALTRQLLAFSRRQELQPRVVNLNEIIGDMGMLFRRVLSETIEVETTLEADLGPVRADAGQMEQVIMNLVVNARDALPRGGTISIRTSNIDLDDAYADTRIDVGPGAYVLVSVSDNGIGMDRETMAHIFEPFFTTKEEGKGTGLGLATVYGIVKQSGGHIWVYSEAGKGTTFKIYLPRVSESGETLQRPPRGREQARTGETVLLVEDDPAVRGLARRVLETRGYRVLEAGTGADAMQVAREHNAQIDLLISDVVVPDMHGADIAQRVVEIQPAVKLLFMSGYTDQDIQRHGAITAGMPFLEKPFTPDSFARKVREVLDQPD